MKVEEIKKIAVIGSGSMGSQIAMVCALAGYRVDLHDIHEESLNKANEMLHNQMQLRIAKGRSTEEQVKEAFSSLRMNNSLQESVQDADFVIEAVVENLAAKRELFAQLDRIAPARTIFATNSSTIVSSQIADNTSRPDKVCNMHFFNPALVMELVEVVQGPHTSDETAEVTFKLSQQIGKTPILLKQEISGFVANRINGKVMDEAISLYEQGIATIEDIDLAITKGLRYPMGPFALMDLVGLDVVYNVRKQRYMESGKESDKPAKTLERKVNNNELGRKTGQGFYTYRQN